MNTNPFKAVAAKEFLEQAKGAIAHHWRKKQPAVRRHVEAIFEERFLKETPAKEVCAKLDLSRSRVFQLECQIRRVLQGALADEVQS